MKERNIRNVGLADVAQVLQLSSADAQRQILFFDNIDKFANPGTPRRFGFITHAVCLGGEATLRINAQPQTLRAGDFLIGTNDQVIDEVQWSADFEGRFMLVSDQYNRETFVGMQSFLPYLVFILERPVIALTPVELNYMLSTFSLIEERQKRTDDFFQHEVVALLLRAYYFDVCNVLRRRHCCPCDAPRHRRAIFERFINLLARDYREHRNLAWYSAKLCVSPKYLSEVVKKVSGRTAGQWVTLVVMLEIKTLLRCSDFSIKEIALRLNFPNQSFLGKFFKASAGISPTEYRNR